MQLITLLFTTLLASTAHAWGAMAHRTVALIANHYLGNKTHTWVSTLLSDDIANIASWADSYRYTSEGAFSAVFHYIDAEDAPPDTCGVVYSRDCGAAGCVVSAIANYTNIISDPAANNTSHQNALKFLVHFLGDITQPLHCDSLDGTGGNTINVLWESETVNLHHLWDTEIPESITGGSSNEYSDAWAQTLIAEIDDGMYVAEKASWVECSDIGDAERCATEWAADSNKLICSAVVPEGVEGVEGQELAGEYGSAARPVVAKQVAKGGVRLAAWLERLAAGEYRHGRGYS